jgi:hypothetical protein
MSVVCILTPVVIAGWPAFSAAVAAAATSLGYAVLETAEAARLTTATTPKVALEIANSEVVTGTLGRDQRIAVHRDGVTVIFSRDERGRASLCVTGPGRTDAELRACGEELSRAVVQSYVYARIKDEMRKREFVVVEEETTDDRSIRLKVRHWEN